MIVSEENIAFEPALPSWKHAALKRLGMGNVAKVPLGTCRMRVCGFGRPSQENWHLRRWALNQRYSGCPTTL